MKSYRSLLFATILFLPLIAQAAGSTGNQSAGSVITAFADAIKDFQNAIDAAAKILFFALLAVEIPVAALKKTLGGDSWEDWMFFIPKVLFAPLFFGTMMIGANKYLSGIIISFKNVGESGSGTFSATNILSEGWTLAKSIVSNVGITDALENPLIALTILLAAVLLMCAFAICAAQVVLAYIESQIVIAVSPIYFAFGALVFTREWATKVFSHSVATGTKILIVMMLGTAMNKLGASWIADLQSENLLQNSGRAFEIIGLSIMMIYLALHVPSIAAAIMSGNTTMGAGSLISGTLGAIAAATAAMAMGSEKIQELLGSGGNGGGEGSGGSGGASNYMQNASGAAGGAASQSPSGAVPDSGSQPPVSPFGSYGGDSGSGGAGSAEPGTESGKSDGGKPEKSADEAEKSGESKDNTGNGGASASETDKVAGEHGSEAAQPASEAAAEQQTGQDVAKDGGSQQPAVDGETPQPLSAGSANLGDASGAELSGGTGTSTSGTGGTSAGGEKQASDTQAADAKDDDDKSEQSRATTALQAMSSVAAFAQEQVIVDNAQAGAAINMSGHNV